MNPSDAIETIEKPFSSLPHPIPRHILEHLHRLTRHEPMSGIMGKSGTSKSSLYNVSFQGKITPISAFITVLLGHIAIHLVTYLQDELRIESARTQARGQPTDAMDQILDTTENVYITSAVRTTLRAVRDTVVSVARAVWNQILF